MTYEEIIEVMNRIDVDGAAMAMGLTMKEFKACANFLEAIALRRVLNTGACISTMALAMAFGAELHAKKLGDG